MVPPAYCIFVPPPRNVFVYIWVSMQGTLLAVHYEFEVSYLIYPPSPTRTIWVLKVSDAADGTPEDLSSSSKSEPLYYSFGVVVVFAGSVAMRRIIFVNKAHENQAVRVGVRY